MTESVEDTQNPSSLDDVLRILKEEGEKRRTTSTAMKQVMIGVVGALLAVQAFLAIVTGKIEFSNVSIVFTMIAVMAAGTAVSKGHNDALKLAKTWQDPLLVPHLLEVMDANDEEIKKDAKAGLGVLLPKLTEEHASAFSSHQLKALGALTKLGSKPKEEEVILAAKAVTAIGRIGSAESLPDLDALAAASPAGAEKNPLEASALQARADLRMRLAKQIVDSRSDHSTLVDDVKS